MKSFIRTFFLLTISNYCLGQIPDSIANAIKCVLLEEAIAKKVFFKYDAEDRVGPYMLPGRQNQAFIYPNYTFQKVFKRIRDTLAYKSIDGYYDVHLFYKISDYSIYVNRGMLSELCVVFEKIHFENSIAKIDFFTSSGSNSQRFKDNYVRVISVLRSNKNSWVVEKYSIEQIEWIEVEKKLFYQRKK